jgi:hypothetical protein
LRLTTSLILAWIVNFLKLRCKSSLFSHKRKGKPQFFFKITNCLFFIRMMSDE